MASMEKQHIGFIGLGIMGKPMAMNLLRAGYGLTVYNRSKAPVEFMVAQGAEAAASPREVAERSEVVITMVTDSPDVEEVILGPNGVAEGVRAGAVVIDMSTISPTVTRRIAAALEERGAAMLDAPVSGGDTGAKAGTLAIMVGGDKEVFERCLPIFQAMGKSIVHVGPNGMGQMTKLCNQVLVAVNNLATCEALLLASKAGLDPAVMIEAVKNGAAGSWQLANLGPKMIARDFAPGFMVRLQQKDLRLALEVARELHLPLPALSLVHQLFASCEAAGEGTEGTQALIKALERLALHRVQ
ncbi:MAG: 2-hydroxy-3-oxopropionate reductase [candidate division KSB1 bacterium]|nr:2-hydroxy-3-oxopropionate reductase [candidate division KSB1 bacterium]MDZ7391995.1 2-hydroxy-3-oxopropionate reductase [candidate division KSB1 bacterium]